MVKRSKLVLKKRQISENKTKRTISNEVRGCSSEQKNRKRSKSEQKCSRFATIRSCQRSKQLLRTVPVQHSQTMLYEQRLLLAGRLYIPTKWLKVRQMLGCGQLMVGGHRSVWDRTEKRECTKQTNLKVTILLNGSIMCIGARISLACVRMCGRVHERVQA